MADLKISQLTDATSVTGTEELPIVQSGVTKRLTVNELKAYTSNTTWEEVSTTTYTVVEADFGGKTKYFTHASGCTVTIPISVATTTGQAFKWYQAAGAGQITFQGDGTSTVTSIDGVLVSGGVKSSGYVEHLGGDDFLLVGQLKLAETHMIPVMAAGMSPSATGGCAALATIASAANQPDIQTLNFDATTAEYAQFAIPMPESWDLGTVTFQPIWSHAAATTYGVVWQLQAVAVSNDDTIAVDYGTAQSSTDTGGTTNDVYVGPVSSAITVGGTPASGDTVFFRINRLPTDGSDTLDVDARLHGIRLYFNVNKTEDV